MFQKMWDTKYCASVAVHYHVSFKRLQYKQKLHKTGKLVARFKVFKVMKIQVTVFKVVTPYSDVADTNILEHYAASIFSLKMEAACSFKTLVSYHIITHCHNPDEHDFNWETYLSFLPYGIHSISIKLL